MAKPVSHHYKLPNGLRIGCPDIDAAALAAFKRINGFTDEQVRQLSDYCLRRSDKSPLWARGRP
jgi:hypothetical protein